MSIERAMKLALAPRASEIGLKGDSSEPSGEDLVRFPCSEVGLY